MHICASQFSKFPGGACPRTPLEGARAGPRRDRVAITSFGVLEFHAPPWLKSWIRHCSVSVYLSIYLYAQSKLIPLSFPVSFPLSLSLSPSLSLFLSLSHSLFLSLSLPLYFPLFSLSVLFSPSTKLALASLAKASYVFLSVSPLHSPAFIPCMYLST